MAKKTVSQEDALLWKDRKRILGMPISFTKYEVTRDRLTLHKGLFTTTTDELLIYRILDITMKRTLGQKIFGVGTISLYSADQSDRTLDLVNIKNPDQVRRFLSKLVEQVRAERGILGREMYGTGGYHDCDGEPMEFADLDGDGIPD